MSVLHPRHPTPLKRPLLSRSGWSRLATGLALSCASAASFAHSGADAGAHHGWLSGLLHPLTGVDHLAAMLALGLWSATTTRRVWAAPLAFAATLLLGALLAPQALALSTVEPLIAVSVLVLGLLLATQTRLPVAAGAALAAGFAVFHGAAHGQELDGAAALAGMVLTTGTLHVTGVLAGRALQRHAAWLPRVAGAGVALLGAALGYSALAA